LPACLLKNQDNNQDKDQNILDAGNIMDALRICDSKGLIVGYLDLHKQMQKAGFRKIRFDLKAAQDRQESDETRPCAHA
jgi:hypothetical protein